VFAPDLLIREAFRFIRRVHQNSLGRIADRKIDGSREFLA
jgi:hypothetical protein